MMQDDVRNINAYFKQLPCPNNQNTNAPAILVCDVQTDGGSWEM